MAMSMKRVARVLHNTRPPNSADVRVVRQWNEIVRMFATTFLKTGYRQRFYDQCGGLFYR